MVHELITIQVGQCGNQIGWKFWETALKEHASYNKGGVFDESLSTFFRNVDTRYTDPQEIPVGDGRGAIRGLKARAILVDMEEGVTNKIFQDKTMRDLFDSQQLLTDRSGSGNNWAHGHEGYGPQYREELIEKIRRPVEFCDSLQSFLMLFSLGGGTGSGVGTYILELLADHFPEAYRFASVVVPSDNDDVITSPYNSVLALNKLSQFADCVLPIDNQSLIDISNRIGTPTSDGKLPFDTMNGIAANVLLQLTSSMRFGGSLNIDLNEITMNLVPFPKLHYLLSSLTPLYSLGNNNIQPRTCDDSPTARSHIPRLDQMFTDAFAKEYQIIRSGEFTAIPPNSHTRIDPRRDTYLACALMVRGGGIEMSDIRRNIERMRPSLSFVNWNEEGWKVGHCLAPPLGQKNSLLCLSNNCCIKNVFKEMHGRFMKLYSRKAHIHHYTDYMDMSMFEEGLENVVDLMREYQSFDKYNPSQKPRRIPVG
ncbi:epsilon tubulin [Planoprotostelium fungivorum]|uniref:Epsilon tubulin n=1 Tax=Planoprotostelium fungivorum TaxID=1890364 RepID=A0A2P6NCZ3_9EUKA|nr:epsilon tubulin [Planoprotostelium fungivorum]